VSQAEADRLKAENQKLIEKLKDFIPKIKALQVGGRASYLWPWIVGPGGAFTQYGLTRSRGGQQSPVEGDSCPIFEYAIRRLKVYAPPLVYQAANEALQAEKAAAGASGGGASSSSSASPDRVLALEQTVKKLEELNKQK
jgi:hypothetical protein